MLKRIFCKHTWTFVDSLMFHKSTYGCTKCGAIRKLHSYDIATWKFKRKMKGDSYK